MKKKLFAFALLIALFISIIPMNVMALDSDTKELNWYYVARVKGETPEPAKESVSFLKEYGGYYVGDTSQKVLYLTFDEGYEKGYTGAILDTLKELKIPAAFFVVKPYIDSEPELIKRMVDEGHLVCNHSNHHPSMASITDPEKFKKELTDVEAAFKELTGKDMPKYFRPPMGKYSKKSLEMTKALGYKSIFWSFAYKDWLVDDQPSESFAIEKIKSNKEIKRIKESTIIETEPWGYENQDSFKNAVIEVNTILNPRELMALLLDIEKDMKRERIFRWGPRVIDLDIIFYDDLVTSDDFVTIPHPRMEEREFVLAPLNEIAPNMIHPLNKKRVFRMLEEIKK